MSKKWVILFFLLLFSVVPIFPVATVDAQNSIYIREDGGVEGTDKILREGNVYTLTENFNGSLIVKKNSTIIDGAGFKLQGTGLGGGINLRAQNCTVMNFLIENYTFGIEASYANNSIFGNIIKNCHNGIYSLTGYSTIKYNTFESNFFSIESYYSTHPNIITNNNFISYRGEFVMIVWLGAQPIIDSNYWGNYYGVDSNGDGIGDTPHVFRSQNDGRDEHPLISPVDITVVPEFTSWITLPLLAIGVLAVVAFNKKL